MVPRTYLRSSSYLENSFTTSVPPHLHSQQTTLLSNSEKNSFSSHQVGTQQLPANRIYLNSHLSLPLLPSACSPDPPPHQWTAPSPWHLGVLLDSANASRPPSSVEGGLLHLWRGPDDCFPTLQVRNARVPN